MLGLDTVGGVAHVIQVALTPVFLLSGIASLLGVLATPSLAWPIASPRWLISWKRRDRSTAVDYGGGWLTCGEGPTCSTPL